MIGLDTNVLVRLLVGDDEQQFNLARTLVKSLTPARPGYISKIAIVEIVWVLRRAYKFNRTEVVGSIERMLLSQEFIFEDEFAVRRALDLYKGTKVDVADVLLVEGNRSAGCEKTFTFDRTAIVTGLMSALD